MYSLSLTLGPGSSHREVRGEQSWRGAGLVRGPVEVSMAWDFLAPLGQKPGPSLRTV